MRGLAPLAPYAIAVCVWATLVAYGMHVVAERVSQALAACGGAPC